MTYIKQYGPVMLASILAVAALRSVVFITAPTGNSTGY